ASAFGVCIRQDRGTRSAPRAPGFDLPRLHLRLPRRLGREPGGVPRTAKSSLDDLVDRAPGGELEVAGGVFKHVYHGNWKLMLDNHLDGIHPAHVHASSIAVSRGAPEPGAPGEESYRDIAIRQMRQNGMPEPVWEAIGLWTTARGHGYMGDYHDDSRLVAAMGNPAFQEYRARLAG